ncbi:MAG: DUF2460 domain-containing protein [Neisseria sp.]|nr:DUF2460 domain-containing protein [Neisseria sp.]
MNAVFPELPGLSPKVKKTPVWSNNIQTSINGRELRAPYYSYPLWRFSLSFEVLRTRAAADELAKLAGFFNARRGSLESFLYDCPSDNKVENQLLGRAAAGQTKVQLVRQYGGFIEPVLAPKDGLAVTVGGRAQQAGRDFAVADNGVLVFHNPLPSGAEIRWHGGFYFRVRFLQDTLDFEQLYQGLWSAKKVEFQSVKR